jgi:surface-anchored protein
MGVAYEDGAWDMHVHQHDSDTEYETDDALLYVSENAVRTRPSSYAFSFIGVNAGEQFWCLPSSPDPALLYLGVGAEDITEPIFDSYDPSVESDGRVLGSGAWLRLDVLNVSGPGDFSIWQSSDDGPNVFVSTAHGRITSDDALWILSGGHVHYNFGFTAPGLYDVTLRASGLLDGVRVYSPETTYHFGVEAVPEPSGMLALLCGGGSLVSMVIRKRTSKR